MGKIDSSRPLGRNEDVEDFLKTALELNYSKVKSLKDIVAKIIDGELGISTFSKEHQTLSSKDLRHESCRNDAERWALRRQIIDTLLTKTRLDDDDKITIKKGGAMPKCGVRTAKKAYIVIGLPASGKSTIAVEIAEDNGAVILDSDYAKRKLPEFKTHLYGASIVHEESSRIITGFRHDNPHNLKALYERCIDLGYNIVLPRIGQNPAAIVTLADSLQKTHGYEVHLILVALSKKDATVRALKRFAKTGRYVSLALIFDVYGNDPSHTYYYLRAKHDNLFTSFGVINTTHSPRVHTDCRGDSPVLKYDFKELILQLP